MSRPLACLALALGLSAHSAAALAAAPGPAGCRENSRSLVFEKAAPLEEADGDLGLRVRLDRSAPVYALNETLYLEVGTSRDSSIEVWQFDALGRLAKLFPAPGAPPIHVRAGSMVRLPGRDLRLRVAPPTGINELRVIARAEPVASRANSSRSVADAALAGRYVRQERQVCFTVVSP